MHRFKVKFQNSDIIMVILIAKNYKYFYMLDTILRCSLFCHCYSNPTKTNILHLYSILQSTGDTLFNTLCIGNCCYALKTQRNVKNSLSAPHKSAAHPGLHQNMEVQDFPGGPVVKTQHFHCRGVGFDPLLGELRSHMPHSTASHHPVKKGLEVQKNRETEVGYWFSCSILTTSFQKQ